MGTALPVFGGFLTIACLTWFFSSRPRLFVRVFVPRESLFEARKFLRDPDYTKGMRWMAAL